MLNRLSVQLTVYMQFYSEVIRGDDQVSAEAKLLSILSQ